MDADGSDPTRLTTGPKIDERPDWSPNGAKIAFSRNGNIWKMHADGSHEVKLTANERPEFGPAFSPNGKRIAFTRRSTDGTRHGVWTIRGDGSLPEHRTFGKFDFFPDWQPI
jgi:TolB protein